MPQIMEKIQTYTVMWSMAWMDHLRPSLCYNRVIIFAPWQLIFTAKFHFSDFFLGNPNKYPNGMSIKYNYGSDFYDLVT